MSEPDTTVRKHKIPLTQNMRMFGPHGNCISHNPLYKFLDAGVVGDVILLGICVPRVSGYIVCEVPDYSFYHDADSDDGGFCVYATVFPTEQVARAAKELGFRDTCRR